MNNRVAVPVVYRIGLRRKRWGYLVDSDRSFIQIGEDCDLEHIEKHFKGKGYELIFSTDHRDYYLINEKGYDYVCDEETKKRLTDRLIEDVKASLTGQPMRQVTQNTAIHKICPRCGHKTVRRNNNDVLVCTYVFPKSERNKDHSGASIDSDGRCRWMDNSLYLANQNRPKITTTESNDHPLNIAIPVEIWPSPESEAESLRVLKLSSGVPMERPHQEPDADFWGRGSKYLKHEYLFSAGHKHFFLQRKAKCRRRYDKKTKTNVFEHEWMPLSDGAKTLLEEFKADTIQGRSSD